MRIKYAVSALAAAAVAPFVVFTSPPAHADTPGQICYRLYHGDPAGLEAQCIQSVLHGGSPNVGPAPAAPAQGPGPQPSPGGNQHCNSLLNNSGNDNTAVYLACCNDAIMAGQTPC